VNGGRQKKKEARKQQAGKEAEEAADGSASNEDQWPDHFAM